MKNLLFGLLALLFSATMSANSVSNESTLLSNEFNNNRIETVAEESVDCLVGVIERYSLYIEVGEDYIYIEESYSITVFIICW